MFDKIAEELKEAREKNGLSLAQVANKSKIDIKFLEAMEQGDFSFLPDLYVRAFVKNFARTVGLNENKIVKKYESAKQGIPYVEEENDYEEIVRRNVRTSKHENQQPIVPKEKRTNQNSKTERKQQVRVTYDAVGGNNPAQNPSDAVKKRNLIIGSFLLGGIFLLAMVYFIFVDKSEQIIVVEKPIEDVIQQNQRYVEENQSAANNEMEVAASDSLILTINAADTSWVKISADKQIADEFVLLPNSQKVLKAQTNFDVTFGNSSAIKLLLNNKPLAFNSKYKSVVTLTIDKDGVKYPSTPTIPR
ncbi:MAG: helix-turn-helix domain-containing protein [Ignavibacteriaceae bacterium]|nr:helix-turn-helix domain-containing protein [Ignavibacteriaceae bacterium]